MSIDRETVAYYCTPIYSIAWALRLDIATPQFPAHVEHYVAWVLTGIIAGLTPIVGTVIARAVQAGIGVSIGKADKNV